MVERSNDISFEALISDICEQRIPFGLLSQRVHRRIMQLEARSPAAPSQRSGAFWKAIAFRDSLARIQLFLEQNFTYIETVGILTVSRYLFELTVWLKLLQGNSRYGLVYYHQLLKTNCDFYKALRINAEREALFLQQIEAAETSLMERGALEALAISEEETRNAALRQLSSKVMQKIDQDAARKFSLYSEQAQTNGYGYQAQFLEATVLPTYFKAVSDIEQELRVLDGALPPEVKALIPKPWKWNVQAELVGMKDEYEFLYKYTSLLMHATPMSLSTEQQSLGQAEMRVLLKYIRVRVLDAAQMAEELLSEPVILQ